MKPRLYALLLVSAAFVGVSAYQAGAADDEKKGTVVKLGDLKSTTPDTWKEEKVAGKLRLQQFTLPKAEGDAHDADVVIFSLGGGTKANIDRWKAQFDLPEGKKAEDVIKETKMKVGDAEVTYLDIRGTYKTPPFDPKYAGKKLEKFRLLGVIIETKDAPYQIRCVGPEKTIEQYKKGFDEWVKGFK
jgi:hypothetical protein